jgi:hypothetical protein
MAKDVKNWAGFVTWLVLATPWSWKMFQRMCISWRDELCESGGNIMARLRLFADLRKPTLEL